MFTKKLYVADTHFGHDNIIRYCRRPFATAREMDEAIIAAWNEAVAPHDVVYHLGDFCIPDPVYAAEVFSRLNGRKHLVLGNHDTRRGEPFQHIMDLAWERPPTESLEVRDDGSRAYLSHYAHLVWPGSHRDDSYHFYGHSHGRLPHAVRRRDVGVDLPDVAFQPRTFRQLVACLPVIEPACEHEEEA